jgi:NAD(P)-dependent dehydrogenase (short-subunit alcohol dehydrogenase family)
MAAGEDQTIVFITGASQGIGKAIARILSTPSLHPGYHVILGALVPKEGDEAVADLLKEDNSRSLSTVAIDVISDASIAEAAETIASRIGRLDVLINNAGVLLDGLDQVTTNRPDFEKTVSTSSPVQSILTRQCLSLIVVPIQFQVNLFGAASVTESFIPLLKRSQNTTKSQESSRGPPRIIFTTSRIASLAAKADPNDRSAARYFPMYRCSKAALNMLMLHYASLYKEAGWKVNGHDPGLTNTPLAQGQKGAGTVEDAAVNAVRLATLGFEGETGTFTNRHGTIPW